MIAWKYQQHKGGTVRYSDSGQGSPLVLVHGFCESGEIFEEVLPRIPPEFRVIIPELPGHGGSEMLRTEFSIATIGEWLFDFLIEIGVKKPWLAGHSMGGYVVLALAKDQPWYPAGICLLHSTPFGDSEERIEKRSKTIDLVKREGPAPFLRGFIPSLLWKKNERISNRVREVAGNIKGDTIIRYSQAMIERPDLHAVLEDFLFPVKIISGRHDSIIPVSVLLELTAPNITHEVLENAAHLSMYECPDECAAEILTAIR